MKRNILLLALILISAFTSLTIAQECPFVEVRGSATDTIEANKIEILIMLNEEPSKGKFDLNTQELNLQRALKECKIDIKEQLTLLSQSQSTTKRTNVYQYKNFLLVVNSEKEMAELFDALDSYKIPEARIRRYYNDQVNQINQNLKAKALQNARSNAKFLAESLGQSIGKAIQITDYSSNSDVAYEYATPMLRAGAKNAASDQIATEIREVELKPIILNQSISARFELK